MHCHQCGTETMESARFCHRCGADLSAGAGEPVGDGGATAERTPAVVQALGQFTGGREQGTLSGGRGGAEAEQLLWRGTYSAKGMIMSWVIAGVLTLAAAIFPFLQVVPWPQGLWGLVAVGVLWLWLGSVLLYRKLSVRYELTNQRFMHYHGLLHRFIDRIEVIDMDDVSQDQTLLERALNVGRIRITGSDRTHPEMILQGIDNVNQVSALLDDARRKERLRRGIYMEQI